MGGGVSSTCISCLLIYIGLTISSRSPHDLLATYSNCAATKEEKIEEMRDEFLKEDANNDGTVSLDELKKYRQKVEGDTYDEATVEVRDALSP